MRGALGGESFLHHALFRLVEQRNAEDARERGDRQRNHGGVLFRDL